MKKIFAAFMLGVFQIFFVSMAPHAEEIAPAFGQIGRATAAKVVYISYRNHKSQIRVMRIDGKKDKLVLASRSGITNSTPRWSPNRKKIVFCRHLRSADENSAEIYVVNANGKGLKRLTKNKYADMHPSWSPDGKRIVFTSNRDGDFHLFTMNANGSAQTALTDSKGVDLHPAWSPDGQSVVFSTNRLETFTVVMASIKIDGSGFKVLVNSGFTDTMPAWSPDGTRIAFSSFRDETGPGQHDSWEIYVMNADGSAQTRLTYDLSRYDLDPTWTPDGQKIIWGSRVGGGTSRLNIMNADGSNQKAFKRSSKASNSEPDA